MHLELGCWGGHRRVKKLSHLFQIINKRLNDPHGAMGINNTQHIVHQARRHWGEANIRKRTVVIHHQVCDVQAPKTKRPTVLLESQGLVLGGKAMLFERR